MINKQDILVTIEVGKLSDVVIVNEDPLQSISNFRKIDTVILNGKVVDRGYHPWYRDPFRMESDWNEPVEALKWVAAFKRVTFGAGEGEVRAAAGALRDPVESPQPAIESTSHFIITEGSSTLTVTIKGSAQGVNVSECGRNQRGIAVLGWETARCQLPTHRLCRS